MRLYKILMFKVMKEISEVKCKLKCKNGIARKTGEAYSYAWSRDSGYENTRKKISIFRRKKAHARVAHSQ